MSNFIKKYLFPKKENGNCFGCYLSYAEALNKLPESSGYEQENLIDVIYEKTVILKEQLKTTNQLSLDTNLGRLMILLNILKKENISIIDFGGACGAHYYQLLKIMELLEEKKKITWHIIETPAMAKKAQSLADEFLKFHSYTNLDSLKKQIGTFDLVYASGSLQYLSNPIAVLKELLNFEADLLYITRTPFSLDGKFYSVQKSMLSANGPGCLPEGFINREIYYPVSFVEYNLFLQTIRDTYSIKMTFLEDKHAYILENKKLDMYGLVAQKKR